MTIGRALGCLVATILCVVLALGEIATAAEPKPNVLLIISEDNGPQFGCYGDRTVPTPNVDALAARGTKFTRAFVTQAVCSPSRASIYTGLYPHQNGQIGLATHKFTMHSERIPTLPKLLGEACYRTGLIGKLHVLPEAAFPFDYRFADAEVVSFQHRDVRRTAAEAYRFIAADDARPFCLTVCFADAHLPFIPQDTGLPAKPFMAADVTTLASVGIDTPRLREHAANYYNCISRLDTGIGLLLDELERSGRAKNTLIIYVGDHGPQFGRGKVTSYELGLRVPLIIFDPILGGPGGGVTTELTSTVDLLPTILDFCRIAPPPGLAGRTLLPLAYKPRDYVERKYLFAEWNTSHSHPGPSLMFPQRTVRDERYKLIRNLLPGEPNQAEDYYTTTRRVETGATQAEIDASSEEVRAGYATWRAAPEFELYDLHADPHEFTNLAGRPETAAVQSRLLSELEQWRIDTNDPLLDPQKLRMLIDEDRLQSQKSQALGRANLVWRYPEYLFGAPPETPK